jgi:putative transposase
VFFNDEDRWFYLSVLHKQSRKFGLRIVGYCLMTNHVHVVAIPTEPSSLAKALGRTHLIYTQKINIQNKRSGHIWQNRFFSCALDEHHLIAALAYVERNPVRAGMVEKAWDYPWSSARKHLNLSSGNETPPSEDGEFLDADAWSAVSVKNEWRDWLVKEDDEEMSLKLRLHTSRGRPLGDALFIETLERETGQRLHALPRGRPKN